MRRALTATIAVALLAVAGAAFAAATADLAKARAEYARSEFQKTIDILVPVLDSPRQKADLTRGETIEAHKLVGLSFFFLSQSATVDDKPRLLESAGNQFTALLYIDPDYELDAAVEGPEASAFFDQVKRDNAKRLDEIRKQKLLDEQRKKRPQRERLVIRVVRDPSRWPNWIPFGYAQFRNGQSEKGSLFLVGQVATFGTSAYFYLSHAFKYGWPTGRLPADPDEVSTIQTEQYIQIGAGLLFMGIYAYGVYDGYRHQRPALSESETISPIKYDDETTGPPAASAPRLQLVPFATSDVLGVGVSLEF